MIEAGESVGPYSVQQETIAANAMIQHSNFLASPASLQSSGKIVGPSVIPIGRGTVPVGDRVTEGDHRSRSLRCCDIDVGDEVPMFDLLGVSEFGSKNVVSMREIRSRPGTGMSGLIARNRVEADGDCQVLK